MGDFVAMPIPLLLALALVGASRGVMPPAECGFWLQSCVSVENNLFVTTNLIFRGISDGTYAFLRDFFTDRNCSTSLYSISHGSQSAWADMGPTSKVLYMSTFLMSVGGAWLDDGAHVVCREAVQ